MLMKQRSLEMNDQEQKQNAKHIASKISSKPFDVTKSKVKRVAVAPVKPVEGIDTSGVGLSIMGNNPNLVNKTRIQEEEKVPQDDDYSSGSSKQLTKKAPPRTRSLNRGAAKKGLKSNGETSKAPQRVKKPSKLTPELIWKRVVLDMRKGDDWEKQLKAIQQV